MSSNDRPRQLRRRHMHERQAVIFGVLLAGLAVAGLVAAAVFSGTLMFPALARGFSSPPPDPSAANLPCPPEGTAPIPYAQINVHVYNGSTRVGLAKGTAETLGERGFVIVGVGDADDKSVKDSAQISFGRAGIAAAYTVAAQFENPVLILDSREDANVDVTVGQGYNGLNKADLITLDPAVPFPVPAACTPLDQITPAPFVAPTATAAPAVQTTEQPPAEGEVPAEGDVPTGETAG